MSQVQIPPVALQVKCFLYPSSPPSLPSSFPLPSLSFTFHPLNTGYEVLGSNLMCIIVQGKACWILVCEWDMKLGIVPLWSASKELQMMFYVWILMSVTFLPKIALSQRLYNPWFFMILGQNSTYSKMGIIWKLCSCWSQWCKFQLHISFLALDTYLNSYPMYSTTWMDTGIVNPSIYKWNIWIGILPVKPFSYWTVHHNPPHYISHFNA